MLRILAVAALLTSLVYLFMPITASGPPGQPNGFFTNTRYLMPALLLALVLLPLAAPLRASARRRAQVLSTLAAVFAITAVATTEWPARYLPGAAVITVIAVAVPLTLAWMRARPMRPASVSAVGVLVAVAVIGLGRSQQLQYAETRYADSRPFWNEFAGPEKAFDWARDLRDARIGIVGAGQVFFTQYGWYGAELSNRVDYVGLPGPRGSFTLPGTCTELRSAVNAGRFDYLVSTAFGTNDDEMERFPVRDWLKHDRGLDEVLEEDVRPQRNWVYEVQGRLDPAGCARLVRAPTAERKG
jgi:hypothetical protein